MEYQANRSPIEVATNVPVAEGRLWAKYQLHPAFGGAKVRVLLLPFSDTTARAVGPLADTGPVILLENPSDEAPRVRFSGWLFDRFAE